MAFTRADMVLYLDSRFSELANELSFSSADTLHDSYMSAIDDALAAYGVSYDNLSSGSVRVADVPGFKALLRYYGLRLLLERAAGRVDIRTEHPAPHKSWSQMSTQILKLMEEARAEAQAAGYDLPDPKQASLQLGMVTIPLDTAEPASNYDG